VVAERVAQEPDLPGAHGHEHGLAELDPGADERHGLGHEAVVPGVEQGLVRVAAGHAGLFGLRPRN
jgi:hypothetical protein